MGLAQADKHKAATLLMNLDSATASELLRGLTSEKIEELAVEMAQINTTGRRNKKDETRIVREFFSGLQKGDTSQRFSLNSFLNETLVDVLGEEKAKEIESQVSWTGTQDIFRVVRSAEPDELALVLEEEHPQMAAVILSELEPKKVQSILVLFDKEFCCKVVWKMAKPPALANRVKQQMATLVSKKLESFKGEANVVQEPKAVLRELAIVLSDVERGLRSEILEDIKEQDKETSDMISNLMVTWEDLLSIADRSLQEALRAVETQKLAIAMHGADEEIIQKIMSNLSKRAALALEEEKALMQDPMEEEISNAREEIVGPLRQANEEGTLRRVQE